MAETDRIDWYERRYELEPGMVFRDTQGDLVKLDHRKPGDGTQWAVDVWYWNGGHDSGSWVSDEVVIEPGDLVEQVPDPELHQ